MLKNAEITASSEQISRLKDLFPNAFDKNGRFMPHKLEDIVKANEVDVTCEGYKLDWLGKSYARLLANLKTETLLAENIEHNAKPENVNSQNMLIQGDNLDVLKHLVNAYSEKVKMIYIDPPYNTGSDGFVYSDNRTFTPEELAKLAGIDNDEALRILDFTQSKSNSHSAWLTFMYPRLYIARELLRDDGVIFISIDDNEQAQLRLLCDEVFGEENFVGELVILTNPKGRSQDKYFATNHEYLLAYSQKTLVNGALAIQKNEHKLANEYKEFDEKGHRFRAMGLRNTHREFGKHNRPNLYYSIFADSNGKVELDEFQGSEEILPNWNDDFEGCWTWEKAKVEKDKDLLFARMVKGTNGNSGRLRIFRRSYASGAKRMVKTFLNEQWVRTDLGQTTFNTLFDVKEKLFHSPKPVGLIKELLATNLENNELVLDFFAGSGTTAHAVMQLNAEDGGNRKYICIQIDEVTEEGKEAQKAGYNTIFEITRERIIRAAKKIQKDHPQAQCDFGFKEYKTIPANEGQFVSYLDDADTMEDYVPFNGMVLDEEARRALLTTWKVYDGLPLTQALQEVDLGGYVAYGGGDRLYFINPRLALKHIIKMLEYLDDDDNFTSRKLVVFHYMFTDKMLREFSEAVNAPNRKHLKLDFIQRY